MSKETNETNEISTKKITDWIRSHKLVSILILIGIFFIPLIAIEFLVDVFFKQISTESNWNVSSLVSYIAGFEALLGTVVLGIATIYLNSKAIKIDETMLENEQKRDKFERQPCVMLLDWGLCSDRFESFTNMGYSLHSCEGFVSPPSEAVVVFWLKFVNATKYYTELRFQNMELDKDNVQYSSLNFHGSVHNPQSNTTILAPAETTILRFIINKGQSAFLHGETFHLHLLVINSIGEKYIETVTFTILYQMNNFTVCLDTFKIEPWDDKKKLCNP